MYRKIRNLRKFLKGMTFGQKNIPLDFCDDESFTTWSLDTVGCVSVTYVVKAKILRPSLKSQGQGCIRPKLKPTPLSTWSEQKLRYAVRLTAWQETRAWTFKAKAKRPEVYSWSRGLHHSCVWCATVYVTYVVSALGITGGCHRLWAHRSYRATLPLRILLAVFQTMAFQVRLCHFTWFIWCFQCSEWQEI